MNIVSIDMKPQTVEDKTVAAVFIATHGAGFAGVRTKACLMYPCKRFTDTQVEKEASSFLGNVHIAPLKAVTPQEKTQILKDQDERLSFVL